MAAETPPLLVWVDAQLPPSLARWLHPLGTAQIVHVADLGLLTAEDLEIFQKARDADAVVLTKDQDFIQLQARLGAPPSIVWLTCGNASNKVLKDLMVRTWPKVQELLEAGEALIEINEVRSLESQEE